MVALPYKPGLCCMTIGAGLKFRTMTRKRFLSLDPKEAADKLDEIYDHNVDVLHKTVDLCAKEGWNYRVNTGIFPMYDYVLNVHTTHPGLRVWEWMMSAKYGSTLATSLPWSPPQPGFGTCLPPLGPIGTGLKLEEFFSRWFPQPFTSDVRFSTHPDQYVVLASEDPVVVKNSVNIIKDHDVLLGVIKNPLHSKIYTPINVHMSVSKGIIVNIATRFFESYYRFNLDCLGNSVLVLENEDRGVWNVENLYKHIYKPTTTITSRGLIPITFDYLHHKCNPGTISERVAFEKCYYTWNTIPLFHYSESIPGDKNPRKHADYPTARPNTYGHTVHIDYEFKAKNLAILKA